MNLETKVEHTFTAPLKNWYNILFISILLTLLFLYWIFFPLPKQIMALAITAIGFGSYYLSQYLTLCRTTISISNNVLTINQDSRILNIVSEVSLKINEIRGFEINQITRGNYALIIYTKANKFYKYPLTKAKYSAPLRDFLLTCLIELKATNNPFHSSFIPALVYALKRACLYILISAIFIVALLFSAKLYRIPVQLISWPTALIAIISFALWWHFIRIPVKRSLFRFGAFFWMSNFFFYTSMFISIPIFTNVLSYNQKPVSINTLSELTNSKNENLFLIKNVSYNPSLITYSSYTIGNPSKNKNIDIEHFYATPATSEEEINTDLNYSFWFSKNYHQKVNKRLPNNSMQLLIDEFHQQTKQQFISSFNEKPIFYVLSESNQGKNNFIRNSYNASENNIVLEPHWENIKIYKDKLRNKIGLYIFFVLLMNTVGCIFIAANR